MTKQNNIELLYNQLTVSGLKEKAIMGIADKCGVTYNSVKSNWIGKNKYPQDKEDDIIDVLQKANQIQYEYLTNIKVNL